VWGGRNLRSATLVLVGALALVAIVATIESGDPTFQSEVAQSLAKRSDAVAVSLARGKRCAADREAERLRADSIVSVRRNLVSPEIAGELLERTRGLARAITCPPPAPARPASPLPPPATPTTSGTHRAPPRSEDREEGQGGDRGKHGRGKERGHRRGDGDSG
jgi:hypothetical protein